MNYYNSLTGEMPLGVFLASLTFALFGWVIYKSITAQGRDRKSSRSPIKWSWSFWFRDNWHEALIHMVIMFCLVRFAPDAIVYFWPDSKEFFHQSDPMLPALVLGFAKGFVVNKAKMWLVR